jgi:hypothetical protein
MAFASSFAYWRWGWSWCRWLGFAFSIMGTTAIVISLAPPTLMIVIPSFVMVVPASSLSWHGSTLSKILIPPGWPVWPLCLGGGIVLQVRDGSSTRRSSQFCRGGDSTHFPLHFSLPEETTSSYAPPSFGARLNQYGIHCLEAYYGEL